MGVTLLSDVMPGPEEVVLSGVAADLETDENADGEIEFVTDPGDLSVAELEALVRDETVRLKSGSRPT